MTAELALRQGAVMADKVEYCRLLADSGLLPDAYRKQPANVLYAVEYGEAIGVPPMAAITGIHIIKGKPSASAGLVGALVRKAGHKLRVQGTDTKARASIVRADDPGFEFVSEWTIERAVTAKLCTLRDGKPYARDKNGEPTSWEKYPGAMLKHRAVTEVARDACEEVLFGLHYTPEELGAAVDEEGLPTLVQEPPMVREPLPAQPRYAERSRQQATDDEWTKPAPAAGEQIEDAEIIPEPEPAPDLATDAQLRAMNTLISKKCGPMIDSERYARLSKFTGREITTSKQVTKQEASRLIDWLQEQPDFILTEEAVIAEAEKLTDVAEPGAVAEEERLRDHVESADTPAMLEQAMQTVFDAEAAGAIGTEAFQRLQGAGSARSAKLKELAAAAQKRRAEQKAQAQA
jgi:hypothetical protein